MEEELNEIVGSSETLGGKSTPSLLCPWELQLNCLSHHHIIPGFRNMRYDLHPRDLCILP